jgi:hypothetical protein
MAQRAGRALRDKWADEARAAARLRDPILRAQDEAHRARGARAARVLKAYGRLLQAAVHRGEMDYDRAFELAFAAQDRIAAQRSAATLEGSLTMRVT